MPDHVQNLQYPYAVYGTAIGGVARRLGSKFFFIELPSNGEKRVNDEVPDDVEIWPANELAREATRGPCGH